MKIEHGVQWFDANGFMECMSRAFWSAYVHVGA